MERYGSRLDIFSASPYEHTAETLITHEFMDYALDNGLDPNPEQALKNIETVNNAFGSIKSGLSAAGDKISGAFSAAGSKITGAVDAAGQWFSELGNNITDGILDYSATKVSNVGKTLISLGENLEAKGEAVKIIQESAKKAAEQDAEFKAAAAKGAAAFSQWMDGKTNIAAELFGKHSLPGFADIGKGVVGPESFSAAVAKANDMDGWVGRIVEFVENNQKSPFEIFVATAKEKADVVLAQLAEFKANVTNIGVAALDHLTKEYKEAGGIVALVKTWPAQAMDPSLTGIPKAVAIGGLATLGVGATTVAGILGYGGYKSAQAIARYASDKKVRSAIASDTASHARIHAINVVNALTLTLAYKEAAYSEAHGKLVTYLACYVNSINNVSRITNAKIGIIPGFIDETPKTVAAFQEFQNRLGVALTTRNGDVITPKDHGGVFVLMDINPSDDINVNIGSGKDTDVLIDGIRLKSTVLRGDNKFDRLEICDGDGMVVGANLKAMAGSLAYANGALNEQLCQDTIVIANELKKVIAKLPKNYPEITTGYNNLRANINKSTYFDLKDNKDHNGVYVTTTAKFGLSDADRKKYLSLLDQSIKALS